MPATCTCGRTWTGLKQAHCSVCHRHFSTVANFDKHKPSYDGCLSPDAITTRTGAAVLKPVEGPFGITWTGLGENDRQGNDAEGASAA